ncbi:MAG: hypothetical protein JXR83_01665 [Deltaproteobacteria bacterium]|nr:hypothetical protein [Deltaproteobacteria bacterium]
MVRVIPGNNITSANVDANKNYIDGRDIANLKEVGAINDAQTGVLERADGIIAALPANGQADVDELVRLEDPNYAATLFPDERAVQPGLWKTLEWSDVAAAAEMAPFAPLAERDLTSSPQMLDYNKQFAIADLPADVQKTAKRVQLVLNSDSNATTINLPDLERAMEPASAARFKPDEIEQMKKTVAFIRAEVRKTAPAMTARIEVPKPGVETQDIPYSGSVQFKLTTNTKLVETADATYSNYRTSTSNRQLNLERSRTVTITPPPGKQVMLINMDTGKETLVKTSQQFAPGALNGKYRVEVWSQGQRVENGEVSIPSSQVERLAMSNRLGFSFVDPSGNALLRTQIPMPSDNRRGSSSYYTYQQRFEYQPTSAPPAPITTSPYGSLKPGVYKIDRPNDPIVVEMFPEGVIRLNRGNSQTWLRREENTNENAYSDSDTGHRTTARYYNGTNLAFFSNGSHTGSVQLKDDQRIA